jgi:hypothetical protein
MSEPQPGVPSTELPGDPSKGAAAFFLVTQLPFAADDASPEELVTVWTHEWADEDETWGVALNGTGQNRLWYGPLYHGGDATVSVRHPAGTAVVAINQQALGVLKPDANEWFCDQDAIPNWEQATLFAIHERLDELGHDVPSIEELLEVGPDAE